MAFKMKGSPAKIGGIQGTSGHTSALKQASPVKDRITKYDHSDNEAKLHNKDYEIILTIQEVVILLQK